MDDFALKERFKELLSGFHARGLPGMVEREIELPEFRRVRKVIVVTGPRRAGKTYLLFGAMKRMLAAGRELIDFAYVNFEDERIIGMRAAQLGLLLDAYAELYPGRKPVVFLDEVQVVAGWEAFVRRLNDSGYSVYVTGSNSRLLSSEIASSLRGRSYVVEVLPFSFREFLSVKGVRLEGSWEYGEEKAAVKKLFGEFASSSGFPEIAVEGRLEFIDEYFKTMLYRDVVERYNIRNQGLMRLLMQYLTRLYAGEYSLNKFNNFAKSSGYASSTSVVQSYSRILGDAYFCFLVNARQKSLKKEAGYIKKAYLSDHGFINYYNLEKDAGRRLENIVYLELRRRGGIVNYFRNGFECDFVTGESCIQVCFTLTPENRAREMKGLAEASGRFGCRRALIITNDQEGREKIGKLEVSIIPAWKWLAKTPGEQPPAIRKGGQR